MTAAEAVALAEIERLRAIFSSYDSSSELARFVASRIDKEVEISDDLFTVLEMCDEWGRVSNSVFNPATERLSQLWMESAREHGTYQLIKQDFEFGKSFKKDLKGNVEIAAASIDYAVNESTDFVECLARDRVVVIHAGNFQEDLVRCGDRIVEPLAVGDRHDFIGCSMDLNQPAFVATKSLQRIELISHQHSDRKDREFVRCDVGDRVEGSVQDQRFRVSLGGDCRGASAAQRATIDNQVLRAQAVMVAKRIMCTQRICNQIGLAGRHVDVLESAVFRGQYIGIQKPANARGPVIQPRSSHAIAVEKQDGSFAAGPLE